MKNINKERFAKQVTATYEHYSYCVEESESYKDVDREMYLEALEQVNIAWEQLNLLASIYSDEWKPIGMNKEVIMNMVKDCE